MSWQRDLEEARRRLESLDPERDLASAIEAAAVWRVAERHSAFFLPLPLALQDCPSLAGAWREADATDEAGDLLGLDAAGRPVVHVIGTVARPERIGHLWWWDADGSFTELELDGDDVWVRRARLVDGRCRSLAVALDHDRDRVWLAHWRDDRITRVDGAERSPYYGWDAVRHVAHADDGAVARILEGHVAADDALADGLARARRLAAGRVLFDHRTDRPEPWPGATAAERLAAPLAEALDGALRAAAAEAGVAAPFVLEVVPMVGPLGAEAFPPFGRLAGAAWRDGVRGGSPHDGAPLVQLAEAVERGELPLLGLVDRLDPPALRACRLLTTAFRAGSPEAVQRAAAPIATAVADRLAALLHATPLPGAADPFLALVRTGAPGDGDGAWRRARAVAGEEHVARFVASLVSTGEAPGQAPALTDRVALEAALQAAGLHGAAARIAREVAADGLLLEAAPDGPQAPASRLGGPPLLPRGGAWPADDEGRDLTFLAAIDVAELPPSTVRDALPATGSLLFFAVLGEDGLEDYAENVPGAAARLLVCDDPVAATGPGLVAHPVVARRLLTLPDGWSAADELGLDAGESEAYDGLPDQLLGAAVPTYWSMDRGLHWVGGLQRGTQGEPPEDDSVLLLHLSWDERLGLCHLDNATLQFRIPAQALAARDWAQAFAVVESG